MKVITGYKQKSKTVGSDVTQNFVEELNDFYCRFDNDFTPENDLVTRRLKETLNVIEHAICITEHDVRRCFWDTPC